MGKIYFMTNATPGDATVGADFVIYADSGDEAVKLVTQELAELGHTEIGKQLRMMETELVGPSILRSIVNP